MADSAQQQPQPQEPMLCAGGCGFYGSDATGGMCSVCWRSQQSKVQQSLAAPSPASPAAPPAAPEPVVQPAAEAPAAEEPQQPEAAAASPAPAEAAAAPAEPTPADDQPEKPVQENRGRCFCCRKKVGLLGFECRCGYVFCSGHRHAQDHACPFDYAGFDKANLAKANTKVVAAKVDKL